jgi:hypothetical protein
MNSLRQFKNMQSYATLSISPELIIIMEWNFAFVSQHQCMLGDRDQNQTEGKTQRLYI